MVGLLDLPYELRQPIWQLAMDYPGVKMLPPCMKTKEQSKHNPASLLFVNRQLYAECAKFFYLQNAFMLKLTPITMGPDGDEHCTQLEWAISSDLERSERLGIPFHFLPYLQRLVVYFEPQFDDRKENQYFSDLTAEKLLWIRDMAPTIYYVYVVDNSKYDYKYGDYHSQEIAALVKREKRAFRIIRSFKVLVMLTIMIHQRRVDVSLDIPNNAEVKQCDECDAAVALQVQRKCFPHAFSVVHCKDFVLGKKHVEVVARVWHIALLPNLLDALRVLSLDELMAAYH